MYVLFLPLCEGQSWKEKVYFRYDWGKVNYQVDVVQEANPAYLLSTKNDLETKTGSKSFYTLGFQHNKKIASELGFHLMTYYLWGMLSVEELSFINLKAADRLLRFDYRVLYNPLKAKLLHREMSFGAFAGAGLGISRNFSTGEYQGYIRGYKDAATTSSNEKFIVEYPNEEGIDYRIRPIHFFLNLGLNLQYQLTQNLNISSQVGYQYGLQKIGQDQRLLSYKGNMYKNTLSTQGSQLYFTLGLQLYPFQNWKTIEK